MIITLAENIYRWGDHEICFAFDRPYLPSAAFKCHFKIVPFHEGGFSLIAEAAGIEAIVNGSDYPYPEGLQWAVEMMDEMDGVNDAQIRKVMRGNAAALLGFGRLSFRLRLFGYEVRVE
ncbi:amidohydrolase family protein [Zhongshania sp.]|uniref:amidohydrolase family protein n=1 Tax=Zhongshania sp. TaxID=1971902 RepID=UPI0035649287